jgi:hypothetical protein
MPKEADGVAGTTVTRDEARSDPALSSIVACPAATACTVPFVLTVATPGADVDHRNSTPLTGVPSAFSAAPWSARVAPGESQAVAGMTSTLLTPAGLPGPDGSSEQATSRASAGAMKPRARGGALTLRSRTIEPGKGFIRNNAWSVARGLSGKGTDRRTWTTVPGASQWQAVQHRKLSAGERLVILSSRERGQG